jgi:hypothetical protein
MYILIKYKLVNGYNPTVGLFYDNAMRKVVWEKKKKKEMMSTTSAQSVLLKYRSNSLAKREKKRRKKKKKCRRHWWRLSNKNSGPVMRMHTLIRRQGIDEGKLSLHNERIRRRRKKK